MAEPENNGGMKKFLKVLGIIAVLLLTLVIVAFGLIVGACGTFRR